jgi:genome maintenance exonuclease 1|tara:strand:- start:49 stop:714 length:666 start_codon:yes stop_codon:yes gene_type:complete
MNQLEKFKLDTININNKRFYITPQGDTYPSVTTVLGTIKSEGLEKWKARVGEFEAQKIKQKAVKRGSEFHYICEDYLDKRPNYLRNRMPTTKALFNSIKPILDNSISNVLVQEYVLWSDYLKTAGRVDLVAYYDKKLSIIDFKSASKPKKPEWVHSYFMQEAAYAVMFEERTKVSIPQLVTIIAVENDNPQVFIESRDDWIHKFIHVRDTFDDVFFPNKNS